MKILKSMKQVWLCLGIAVAVTTGANQAQAVDIVLAANQFLASLDADQRALAEFDWDSDQRKDWHFIPKTRKGLPLKDLTQDQQHLAYGLLTSVMSQDGAFKALTIMSFEQILWELENKAPHRDPSMYHFSFFGEVASDSTWGLSIEGHHLSVNATISAGQVVASTPIFYGTNPDIILQGPRKGMQILSKEQSLAFELIDSLSIAQRQTAVLGGKVPNDILTAASQKVGKLTPAGISAGDLNGKQKRILMQLIREYIFNQNPAKAAAQMKDIRAQDGITFAWVGTSEQFSPHYYRIQGDGFLIEYANIQNGANHAHAVLRDPSNDFGDSWIAEHLKKDH